MTKFYFKLIIFLLGVNFSFAQTSDCQKIKIIKDYLIDKGLNPEDINDLKVQSSSFSKSMNLTNIYVIQQYRGIPIKNAIGSFAIHKNKVFSFMGKYHTGLSTKVNTITYTISPENAVRSAARSLGLESVSDLNIIEETPEVSNSFVLSDGNISLENIPVKLVYELKDDKLVLCWDLSIHLKNGKHYYSMRIDATDGKMISKNDMIVHCTFEDYAYNSSNKTSGFSMFKVESGTSSMLATPSYTVFPIPVESPNYGSRKTVSGIEDPVASPFGWHDTNGVVGAEYTTTRGNNVNASEDFDANDILGNQPDGGANLVFDFPYDPTAGIMSFQNASITNMFYINNVMHDVWYKYGFDEASGNFQFNNYNHVGEDGDEVIVDVQDRSSATDATFMPYVDGTNPRMQMHLWNLSSLVFKVNTTEVDREFNVINNVFKTRNDPPVFPDAITADLVLATDDDVNSICSSVSNADALKGKIAVVRRGGCSYLDKVKTCQAAGAIAIIIVNNKSGNITMGAINEQKVIPSISLIQTEGEALIAEMATRTVNVSLSSKGIQDITALDGAFDNGIIMHEYGHGITARLTGGADTVDCLKNKENLAEGWSDWIALVMTIEEGDKGTDSRGVGTFVKEQPSDGAGIRKYPYSTDMTINPVTYDSVKDETLFSNSHGIGFIWGSILWDLTWKFIERDGFDPDLYNGTGGNNLVMNLVMNGLKLQPCKPGFVDARDGILEAADQLPNSIDNKCLIWDVFKRRGVGYTAVQGSSDNRLDQVAVYDSPPTSVLNCTAPAKKKKNNSVLLSIEPSPNPSHGIFDIGVSNSLGNSIISIFDINGRVVYTEKTVLENKHTVQSNLQSGIYILKVETESGSLLSNSKIVIK